MTSLFGGTGFILGHYNKMYPDETYVEPRNSLVPKFNNIIYGRGTNSNYASKQDLSIDVRDNILLFTETLKNVTPNHNIVLMSSWFADHALGFYSVSKLAQALFLESFGRTYGVPFKIVKLCNIFGGDSKAGKQKNALEFLIGEIKAGRDIEIYEGTNYRNFLDVSTCCRAIKFVIENGENGQTYNIGNKTSHRVEDLLQFVITKTGSKSKMSKIPTPAFHQSVQIKDHWFNTTLLQNLGFDNDINIYKEIEKIL